MKEKFQTQKLIIFEDIQGSKTTIYRQHKEDESKQKVEIYSIENGTYKYVFNGKSIKEIEFDGFDELPDIVSPYGYGFDSRTISNFFNYKFEDTNVNKIIISETKTSQLSGNKMVINLKDLKDLVSSINQEQRACNDTKSILIKNFLADKYPALTYEFSETNNNKELVLRNLNNKLLKKLTADDVEEIGKFYVEAATKYKRPDVVKRMVASLQKSSQLLSLQEIVNKYEKLLADNPPESSWQKFFEEYITLFDNRYFRQLDYKNIATGITKYPDLVLVDIYGYVDFYELKKSSTPILKYDSSHKTYYWSKDFAMAIAQASDYIQKAKENSLSYAKTIKEQTSTDSTEGLDVNIINPRAIIVAGSSNELNNEKKKNHFKNLRESLKNIEFILYDELLDRLRNLLNSIKFE